MIFFIQFNGRTLNVFLKISNRPRVLVFGKSVQVVHVRVRDRDHVHDHVLKVFSLNKHAKKTK